MHKTLYKAPGEDWIHYSVSSNSLQDHMSNQLHDKAHNYPHLFFHKISTCSFSNNQPYSYIFGTESSQCKHFPHHCFHWRDFITNTEVHKSPSTRINEAILQKTLWGGGTNPRERNLQIQYCLGLWLTTSLHKNVFAIETTAAKFSVVRLWPYSL